MTTRELLDPDVLDYGAALTDEQRAHLLELRSFLREEVEPHVGGYWSRDEFAHDLIAAVAARGYADLDSMTPDPLHRAYALAELARVDMCIHGFFTIHNDLIVASIDLLGSPEQKERWLPGLRSLEFFGSFALTEPEHGSDVAGGMSTTVRRDGDGWVLNGAKRWIGGATMAKIAIVWARDEDDGQVKGFIVETDTPGYSATKIENKASLRIIQNADVTFTDVRLPADALLEHATSFSATNTMLMRSRGSLVWQAVGAQLGILDHARSYALERKQFGQPIARFQLMQALLVQIAGNTASTLGLAHQEVRLLAEDRLTMPQASLIKLTASRHLRESASLGRQLMGGDGILADRGLGRFCADAEGLITYEGTYEVNSLIVGRSLTGISAFV